ncbi:bifunctional 2-methylcitrate synthase/citrate synthase [Promicromonospora sp. NPDC023987]|uniref:bifunctional 2-methylcitrate synthase/citrate synthase n=1 Tax=Promicromonospora sp. NPDC023987 TaxID=3155360 RepID=UPI0033DCEC10
MPETTEIRKGLAGVVADTSAISKVNPETNSLLYRGYPVQELAAKKTFEEVAYLLWHGELPTPAQLTEQTAAERVHRELPDNVRDAILELPTDCHPMDVCRTAVSILGAHDPQAEDSSVEAELAKSLRLWAVLPAVVALDQRRRRGQEVVHPREDLGYSANFLWMTFGEEAEPAVVQAFEASMVLYAEHSFNASTFTARVITSTLADLHSAVTGAIGALKGALHGGANEAVQATFEEIGSADKAEAWLEDALTSKKKIMGFGHRVYKNGDSRVPTMRAVLGDLAEHYGQTEVLDLYDTLENAMGAAKNIKPNLDYPAGPAYHLIGFDTNIFTPLFVASRITGWTAHIMEQRAANALIRPVCEYVGPEQREVP